MKIKSLQISNILSFKYYEDISLAPKLTFDDGLNILIGQNGAGKSTALEVINFIFKRVFLHNFKTNHGLYQQRNSLEEVNRKQVLTQIDATSYAGFRLEPNWNTQDKPQTIRIEIVLDDIDKANISMLEQNAEKLKTLGHRYFKESNDSFYTYSKENCVVDINLHNLQKKFTTTNNISNFSYLLKYNLFKELISLYNAENPKEPIPQLYESFTLIGGYRNYNSFTPNISIGGNPLYQQLENIAQSEYSKSTNTLEQLEPTIFNLVRLRLSKIHKDECIKTGEENAFREANQQLFVDAINRKLELVNLKIGICITNHDTWSYAFTFFDTKRRKELQDINSLSAGQKAIIHLVFEAYGRGELKGGVIIIDEPEIHLHYQFQHEYLKVIKEINQEHNCQYILVTHSESLINSETIASVKRFTLADNYTTIKCPSIDTDQKTLIKILDNTRSTYALFAKKVILVEGDTDRYFFKAAFKELYPNLEQEIAILDIGGKESYTKWKIFFEGFGLQVFFIGDFDNVFSEKFPSGKLVGYDESCFLDKLKQKKLQTLNDKQKSELLEKYSSFINDPEFLVKPKKELWQPLSSFFDKLMKVDRVYKVKITRRLNTNIDSKIEEQYKNKIFFLKNGDIESYTNTKHANLNEIIAFCEDSLPAWLNQSSREAIEIKSIMGLIAKEV